MAILEALSNFSHILCSFIFRGLNLFIATNALQNILEGITVYSIIVIFLIHSTFLE
ncbi:hypothetical protein [Peribacillus simplex]|uniref:hypothetical protein n=1 Tax=Peribacillus simplex TaxID=1478 RepID=UPI003D2B46FE